MITQNSKLKTRLVSAVAGALVCTSLGMHPAGAIVQPQDSQTPAGSVADDATDASGSMSTGSSSFREANSQTDTDTPEGLKGAFVPRSPINDPQCRPSPAHPNPVIFIHGTSANANKWKEAANELSQEGYCTWSFNYGKHDVTLQAGLIGTYGLADINKSVDEVGEVVDYVRKVSGQDKVDLVGHSQGGTLTKMYIADRKQAAKVRRVVGVSATYHGTTLNGADRILRPILDAAPKFGAFVAGTAPTQQLIGSPVINHLNSLPDTDKRVVYTNVYTPADTTATPNSTSQLKSVDGASVANVDVAKTCGLKKAPNHATMPTNPAVISLIKWGLNRQPSATTPTENSC